MADIQNTYKNKKNTAKQSKGLDIQRIKQFFTLDSRLKITLGIIIQAMALCLLIAFIGHLVHGNTDQSTVEALQQIGIRSAGKSIHNWLGIVGATMAYYLMYRWFGITAFLLLPPLYIAGAKLLQQRFVKNISLLKVMIYAVIGILWCDTALGYLNLYFPDTKYLTILLGGLAFTSGELVNSLFGWGTTIILAVIAIIYSVYAFNVTALPSRGNFFTRFVSKIPQRVASVPECIDDYNKKAYDTLGKDCMLGTAIVNLENEEYDREEEASTASNYKDIPLSVEKNNSASETVEQLAVEPAIDNAYSNPKDEDIDTAPHTVFVDYDPKLDLSGYKYPTIDLLEDVETTKKEVTPEELRQNKDKIVQTLTDFKIGIASIKATIGPTVTLYEIIPEPGVKISKIKNLEDDIALNLAALGIRIIAPIPGKGTIGIEVPNKQREMVPFRDILTSEKFTKSVMELPIILGKSISNEAIIMDLVQMPHVLIAGATGQGKSVGLNVLLASLIYKKHPSQLKLVLVDPKKVELSLYSHLEKHFLATLPDTKEAIITETKKVVDTLNSLCIEMDQRYDLLKKAGTRNIKEYNHKFIKRKLNPTQGHRFLPYIVLVIDEFADMMMTAGKEVELPIARLAQLARAIGIHLVLATQRPSVNVITGIIKANFPVRISFRVTSRIDSRTILDTGGAEQLIGQGDMLLSTNSSIIRLQCPFLSTQEIEDICHFIGKQQGYSSAYLLPEYESEEDYTKMEIEPGEQDPLFEEAARLIVIHQQGSTSLIQRKLKLGYNRAGRLIDQLEVAGVVGPFEGSKARDVLVQDERTLETLLSNCRTTG